MPLNRFTATFDDRALAYATAAAAQDFIEPPPEALTVFEAGPGKWKIEAYFDDDGDAGAARDLSAELQPWLGATLPPFVAEAVPDRNWVAISQAALPPVEAGRFTIHGTHDVNRVARGPNTILIDAGEAFGTAHHATTLGCLLAIDRLTRVGTFRNVLDLGCGSGVLAIAAARSLPRASIIATDMDLQSVRVARENARINGAAGRIAIRRAAGVSDAELRRRAPFDLVVANILAGPLLRLSKALARAVMPGGTLLLSGILIPQAPEVIAAYLASGFSLSRHDRIVGWSTLTLVRNRVARPTSRA